MKRSQEYRIVDWRKGTHTWDKGVKYYQCPSCGKILESRQPYLESYNELYKDLNCSRCHHQFTVTKERSGALGPEAE